MTKATKSTPKAPKAPTKGGGFERKHGESKIYDKQINSESQG
jgi:hypothetical protein